MLPVMSINSIINVKCRAQSSLSIFAQNYMHKCEDTYYILQNKPLVCIYEDSFGAKILRDNCTHRKAKVY